MGGLRTLVPASWFVMIIGTLALTGFPLTAGFFSKDAIVEAAYAAQIGPHMFAFSFWWLPPCLPVLQLAADFLTFYGLPRCSNETLAHVHESPPVMLVPLIILALGALFAWLYIL